MNFLLLCFLSKKQLFPLFTPGKSGYGSIVMIFSGYMSVFSPLTMTLLPIFLGVCMCVWKGGRGELLCLLLYTHLFFLPPTPTPSIVRFPSVSRLQENQMYWQICYLLLIKVRFESETDSQYSSYKTPCPCYFYYEYQNNISDFIFETVMKGTCIYVRCCGCSFVYVCLCKRSSERVNV